MVNVEGDIYPHYPVWVYECGVLRWVSCLVGYYNNDNIFLPVLTSWCWWWAVPEASVCLSVSLCVSPSPLQFPCLRAVLAGERGPGGQRTVKRDQRGDLGITGISDLLSVWVCWTVAASATGSRSIRKWPGHVYQSVETRPGQSDSAGSAVQCRQSLSGSLFQCQVGDWHHFESLCPQ